jgi:hypothetical protein
MGRLRTIWRLLNLPCEDLSRLASESLDRDLDLVERVALRSHVIYCRACRRYLAELLFIRKAMERLANRALDEAAVPGPDLPDDVRERIKQALKNS